MRKTVPRFNTCDQIAHGDVSLHLALARLTSCEVTFDKLSFVGRDHAVDERTHQLLNGTAFRYLHINYLTRWTDK